MSWKILIYHVMLQGLNWTVTIKFSDTTIAEIYLDVYQVGFPLYKQYTISTFLSNTDDYAFFSI